MEKSYIIVSSSDRGEERLFESKDYELVESMLESLQKHGDNVYSIIEE